MEQCQHDVGHRRAVLRDDMEISLNLTVCVTGKEQRAPLVSVHIGVAQRRPGDYHHPMPLTTMRDTILTIQISFTRLQI